MKHWLILLFLFAFTCFNIHAQEYIVLRGKTKSQTDQAPLAFAAIHLKHHPIVVTCNEIGEYELNIASAYLNDTVVIVYIGYQSLQIPVKNISLLSGDFMLDVNSTLLHEVRIRPTLNASEVLEKVYRNQKLNYNTGNFVLDGFFRTYLQIDNIRSPDRRRYLNPFTRV
jgi:hypothetical protein